jgi:hypothetical protein
METSRPRTTNLTVFQILDAFEILLDFWLFYRDNEEDDASVRREWHKADSRLSRILDFDTEEPLDKPEPMEYSTTSEPLSASWDAWLDEKGEHV